MTIYVSLLGIPRSWDGPLKYVAMPRNTHDSINVKRLATQPGKYCTIIIDGMNVNGMIVNMYPIYMVVKPNSSSLGAKIGSSCVSQK